MNRMSDIEAIDRFLKYLRANFGCVNCKYLEINDLPIEQRKCTNTEALNKSKTYPNGVEYEKDWLRKDDIKQGLNKDQDVNIYFMCFYFKGIEE